MRDFIFQNGGETIPCSNSKSAYIACPEMLDYLGMKGSPYPQMVDM